MTRLFRNYKTIYCPACSCEVVRVGVFDDGEMQAICEDCGQKFPLVLAPEEEALERAWENVEKLKGVK